MEFNGKVGIIGAGSFGTACAILLSDNNYQVTMWSCIESEIQMLNEKREHVDKLPGVKLADSMIFTIDMKTAIEGMDFIVLAVPSVFTRSTAKQMKDFVADGQIIVNVSKGIEENTCMILSDIIEEEIPQAEVTVMCGPSHAEEVGRRVPTTVVVGAKNKDTAEFLQKAFDNEVSKIEEKVDFEIEYISDTNELEKIISKFRSWKGNLNTLYLYITDYKNFKKWYFDGIQKYLVNVFRNDDQNWHSVEDEIDDMMSDIWSDPENIKNLKVPERIKKESKIMEKFLNFYLTLIWGFWIARWDSLNLRLFKKDLINDILSNSERWDNKSNTIHYYGSMLYNYGKNVFYYKNVSDNVRAGKQKFFLPYKNTNKNIYSNNEYTLREYTFAK